MVAGTSRFLALEGDYRDFLDLVAVQIGAAVTQASSYEEERKRAEALAELDRAPTSRCPARTAARTPAVALTAYGRLEDRMRTLSAEYSMHVPKSVDPAEITTVVASLAGRI